MRHNRNFVFLPVAALAALSALPAAFADEWNKETEVTFSAPVAAPGVVLQAGSYIFKLADSDSDRYIVQIFRKDGDQLVATLLTIPTSRAKAADDTVITFEERPAGQPEAIHEWFYPGETDGVEFIYKDRVQADTAPSAAVVESADDEDDDAVEPTEAVEDSSSAVEPTQAVEDSSSAPEPKGVMHIVIIPPPDPELPPASNPETE